MIRVVLRLLSMTLSSMVKTVAPLRRFSLNVVSWRLRVRLSLPRLPKSPPITMRSRLLKFALFLVQPVSNVIVMAHLWLFHGTMPLSSFCLRVSSSVWYTTQAVGIITTSSWKLEAMTWIDHFPQLFFGRMYSRHGDTLM